MAGYPIAERFAQHAASCSLYGDTRPPHNLLLAYDVSSSCTELDAPCLSRFASLLASSALFLGPRIALISSYGGNPNSESNTQVLMRLPYPRH